MILKIIEGSENYTCQVIDLPVKQSITGLDNLMKITHQGNDCLVGKEYENTTLYLFFPAECQLSEDFCKRNNLYRDATKNLDGTKKGYIEDSRRVKAIKFKGVTSTGLVMPLSSLPDELHIATGIGTILSSGDEFNSLSGTEICRKYVVKQRNTGANLGKSNKVLDNIVDSKLAPEHFSTEHLLKNADKLKLTDYIAATYKLHGTSARYFNTLTYKKLSWFEKLLKKFGVSIQTQEYSEVVGSRKVIKSIGFDELANKNHFYKESGDIWTKVGKEYFKGKLHKGEAVYCEIVGKTYTGEAIQHGYSYGFDKPELFIYRISNINPQGIEVDLSYHQMKERAKQLGIKVCPELFYGKLFDFLKQQFPAFEESRDLEKHTLEVILNDLFYLRLLEKPSIFDPTCVEEGFCIRIDDYPKPHIYKIKSKKFLLHEGVQLDKQVINIEDEQAT